ncbi:MAG: hypothetical protein ACRD0H_27650 [Actinomycetes bacterium]
MVLVGDELIPWLASRISDMAFVAAEGQSEQAGGGEPGGPAGAGREPGGLPGELRELIGSHVSGTYTTGRAAVLRYREGQSRRAAVAPGPTAYPVVPVRGGVCEGWWWITAACRSRGLRAMCFRGRA